MANSLIKVTNLTKTYGKKTVVDDVSFEIKEGSIVGLVGPNGAGKTTIMKMLGGLALPTSGEISIYGETTEKGLAHSRGRMSFIIEAPYIKQDFNARDNLEIQRLQKGIPNKKRIDEVLEQVGLSDVGKKPSGKFSLGMKQRLGIANALLAKPEIMILDEPINGLDPEGIIEIRKLFQRLSQEEHITIVISSHILSELSLLCTDYLFLSQGKIVKDITAEDLCNECRQYFEVDTENNSFALMTLEKNLNIHNYEISPEGTIRIYQNLDDLKMISKCLYEAGFIPTKLALQEANLEQYYMNLVSNSLEEK